jgi:hypothetical protein
VLRVLLKDSPDASKVDGDILSRLNPKEEDAPVLVSKKFQAWKIGAAILEDNFQSQVQIIDVGEITVTKLFDSLCYKLYPDGFKKNVIHPRSKQ